MLQVSADKCGGLSRSNSSQWCCGCGQVRRFGFRSQAISAAHQCIEPQFRSISYFQEVEIECETRNTRALKFEAGGQREWVRKYRQPVPTRVFIKLSHKDSRKGKIKCCKIIHVNSRQNLPISYVCRLSSRVLMMRIGRPTPLCDCSTRL